MCFILFSSAIKPLFIDHLTPRPTPRAKYTTLSSTVLKIGSSKVMKTFNPNADSSFSIHS